MKTLKKQIGLLALLFALLMNFNGNAQKTTDKHKLFVRVYNLEGKKIGKGHVNFLNDSLLELEKDGKLVQFNVNEIGALKTKRSAGHDILVGSLIGGASGALIGAASSHEETNTVDAGWLGVYQYTSGVSSGAGAAIGGSIGILGGGLTGLGISAFKNSETFYIDGRIDKWKIFKEAFQERKID